jgi:hypothetical protein
VSERNYIVQNIYTYQHWVGFARYIFPNNMERVIRVAEKLALYPTGIMFSSTSNSGSFNLVLSLFKKEITQGAGLGMNFAFTIRSNVT